MSGTQEHDVGDEDNEGDQEANPSRSDARHSQQTNDRDGHRHRATEQDHLSVQRDPSRHDGAQAQ